ncbi:MAG: winged helix-turn-helix transcriptional regulator [Gammaproteobacteria bacterium]|nr:winged helix-turn-helix transcriptional regulator [Gammaproteobacteria bacterium]
MSKEQPASPVKQSAEEAALTANALKAMANPLRWRIICALGSEELSVGDIVERIGTSQSNISQHLILLKAKNIIKSRKDANKVYYSISNDQLLLLISNMRTVLCHTNLDD